MIWFGGVNRWHSEPKHAFKYGNRNFDTLYLVLELPSMSHSRYAPDA
jgi:hypothetical protein